MQVCPNIVDQPPGLSYNWNMTVRNSQMREKITIISLGKRSSEKRHKADVSKPSRPAVEPHRLTTFGQSLRTLK
ncbi:hypothetical protein M8J77_023043 [Diaphorina citri]|nr:hypothetical protein M8J77_023043 [Diaphorina citri]